CYEHAHIIGQSAARLSECEEALLRICDHFCRALYAWCILPNHYHALIKTDQICELRQALGQFHGNSSFRWNEEDSSRGRKVWHNCFERTMRSRRHFWATMNYVHHNPVHHGYVDHWQDWPWSSAGEFVEAVGRPRALELWLQYPILGYGKKWDR
ncbi:MAG TPA: transposase, partial [Pyrinomonadaceae bacterium]